MSWGSVKTWNLGETVTSEMMNEQVRDKLVELWKYAAKGDIMVASGSADLQRVPAGSNNQVLIADSGQTAGVKYADIGAILGILAKGDLLFGSGANALARVGVGSNGQTLVADSSQTAGVRWGSVAPLFASANNTSGFETASATYVDITSLLVNINMPTAGTILAFASGSFRAAQVYDAITLRLMIDGTASDVVAAKSCNGSQDVSWVPFTSVFVKVVSAGTRVVKAQLANTGAGHNTVYMGNANIIAIGFPG